MDETSAKGSGGVNQSTTRFNLIRFIPFLLFLFLVAFIFSCAQDENLMSKNVGINETDMTNVQDDKMKKGYEVTNLVADSAGFDAAIIDPNLVNAWGIALSPTGVFWISAEATSLSTIYNDEGMALRPPVTMDGAPTGQVFNFSTGFLVGTAAARFIFVTEDGKITAWRNPLLTAPTIIDDSDEGASYTGAELAMNGDEALLYVANVAGGEIEVYDSEWAELEDFGFEDPSLPMGASPFNIQLVYGQLYVTYVGGGGLVNVFNTNGDFVRRFATGGTLSAPWGITNCPPDFGLGQAIIVGNFGDGRINVYNKNGQFKGQLADEDGEPIVIDGLWDLVFKPGAFDGTSEVDLYFTAGPDNETHGIFGEIEFELAEEE